jgi:rhamnosyl/mannosyltransferase
MRSLHIGKYYPPYPGGIETYCKIICEGLTSKGINVDVVVSNNINKFSEEVINNVKVYRLPRRGVLSSIPVAPSMIFFLRKLIKNNNYDVVHLHFPNPMGEIAYLFAGYRGKLIITYHTDASMRNKLKLLYAPAINKILSFAHYIIVTSENYLKKLAIPDRLRNKCKIVPIPVRPYFISANDTSEMNQIKAKYGDYVFFVGNLSSYKGPEYLIRAIKNINCNLVIAGIGSENLNLRNEVESLGLGGKVSFLGRIDDKDLRNFYDACKVFCLPSISSMETFGIVLLEAMARGKPIVSTEIGTGTSFVNLDGRTGFVVPSRSSKDLSDAINRILSDNKLREQMGINARKRVFENFTVGRVIDSIVELYKN